jgi:hypothetical protein
MTIFRSRPPLPATPVFISGPKQAETGASAIDICTTEPPIQPIHLQWNESQFEYVSRLRKETRPVDEVSYTPGGPFFAKLKLVVFF